jgi:uncharacterized protein YdaU (DUF1376 family)
MRTVLLLCQQGIQWNIYINDENANSKKDKISIEKIWREIWSKNIKQTQHKKRTHTNEKNRNENKAKKKKAKKNNKQINKKQKTNKQTNKNNNKTKQSKTKQQQQKTKRKRIYTDFHLGYQMHLCKQKSKIQ